MTTAPKAVLLAAFFASSFGPGGAAQNRGSAGQPAPPAPSSFELIDRALKARDINEETAHKYRVFAGFDDSRLPAKYRGDDGGLVEFHPSIAEAGKLLRTFSAQTQAELRPFFQRPDHPGSWITLSTVGGQAAPVGTPSPPPGGQGGSRFGPAEPAEDETTQAPTTRPTAQAVTWRTVSAAGGYAKVWAQDRYPDDYAKAKTLASELSTRIWDKLTKLMNQVPETDNGFADNGGDYALDFYLIHAPHAYEGQSVSSDLDPCLASRYLLIDSGRHPIGSATQPGILQIATHEFMHTIQAAYGTKSRCSVPWIWESTATWAESFVYPLANSEHPYAKPYMAQSYKSLDEFAADNFYYGIYLLPYFLEQATGGAGFMPRMWNNFRTMDVLEGVNAVLPGGFDKTWPRFLVQIWNQPPVDVPNGYKQWDKLLAAVYPWGGLDQVATPKGPVTRTIDFPKANPARFTFSDGVLPLAGHFRHFAFDKSVRSVAFENTVAQSHLPHASVWGIEKIGGKWKQPVDWSHETQVGWCRDDAQENIEELVLIFGNSDWETKKPLQPAKEPTVKAYPTGCTAWVGTVSATFTMSNSVVGTQVETDSATVRFELNPSLGRRGGPRQYWKSTAGTIQWTASASGGKCTLVTQGSVPIGLGPDQNAVANLELWDDGGGKQRYTVSIGPWPARYDPRSNYTCQGSPQAILPGVPLWWATEPAGHLVSADGKTLTGTYRKSIAGATWDWSWTLRASP